MMGSQMVAVAVLLAALAWVGSAQMERDEVLKATEKLRRLPADVCGQPSEKLIEKKITNGQPAELGRYPWMAAIGYSLGGSGIIAWNCGGSLVTDQYVLTAAHCVDPSRIQKRRPYEVSVVRLGELNLDDSVNDGASPIDVDVEKVVFHEQYDNDLKINDIGLVKMKTKVQFTDVVKPICLPPADFLNNLFDGYYPVVIGWGRTSGSYARGSSRLLEAEVEVQNLDQCRQNITSVFPNVVIDNTVICASSPGKDACQGDSGGPLMLSRRFRGQSRMCMLGVVSYGYKCAEPGFPGVYTRVAEHMSWIIDNLDI